ncbi:mannosyltransferase [Xylophilus sp. Kf1]|nr:mannosyltransferase [Xylophilus sp. Kf1]
MMIVLWLVPVLLAWLAVVYWRCTPPIRQIAPAHEWLLEGTARSADPVPRKVWSYWHDDHPPVVVRLCVDNWKALNPGYEVQLLSARTVADFLPDVPASLSRLGAAKQSDWIRLALLERHGGVWLDSSIILTTSLDWMLERQQATGAEYVGFYLDRYARSRARPLVDSWCMAAPPGAPFIRDWLLLFRAEVVDGDTEDYLAALRAAGRFDDVVQKLGSPSYHTVHVCAQDLLQRHPDRYRLLLLHAEDSAYAFQARSRWKRRRLYVHLLFNPVPHPCPPLIKLRGGERRKLEPYVRLKLLRRRSIVGRYLFRTPP